ncbi:MAG: hypothetical protein IT354_01185 [Gemmatimonadaceae bacterium]|nr:hypothetical protein [Gemmatimonadaceae bacterium]
MPAASVDAQFELWMRTKFAVPLKSISAERTMAGGIPSVGATGGRPDAPRALMPRGAFIETMRSAMEAMGAQQRDSARVRLERANALFPDYGGADGPAWYLAELARDRGDTATALSMLSTVTARDEVAWEPNVMEADLREARRDVAGATAAIQRLLWIWPYDNSLHERLAVMATARGDHALALRERRAVLANQPSDVMNARFELARALAATGDVSAARREVLQILEQAPSFEKAQALLLELRGKPDAFRNSPVTRNPQ